VGSDPGKPQAIHDAHSSDGYPADPLGFLLGAGFAGGSSRLLSPERIAGGMLGVGVASVLWMVMMLAAYYGGDSLLLSSAKARRIQKEDLPQLWNVVEEMTIASGLGQMPKVYIIDDPEPNAFAVGRSPETASIAVTMGLLRRLNRDELQGVVAHEIGHIRNLDVRFMTLASVTLGTIVLLSEVFLRSMWYGGGRGRRRSSSSGGGQAQAILLVAALLVAILAPIAAQLLYFACSRKREYLADASAARFTRYPLGLASALEKIASTVSTGSKKVSRALAPMYIVNPLQSRSAVGLFSTHPPTEDRIRILRSMAGGAGLAQYEEAYRKVHGEGREARRSLERDTRRCPRAAIVPPSGTPIGTELGAAGQGSARFPGSPLGLAPDSLRLRDEDQVARGVSEGFDPVSPLWDRSPTASRRGIRCLGSGRCSPGRGTVRVRGLTAAVELVGVVSGLWKNPSVEPQLRGHACSMQRLWQED
jgi:heat shock protein HtpX